ncbi:hypothetical protein XAXN_13060 [Xanthomonas axonopodis]|uniref:Uncharacterized protein n=1 Tax=Xanthomonas axonopodis TaxID=53413 RepID=A0A0P6VQS0_9XANT|nr:hypothetical protein XAXN_13060 [Xanthomonas axonopodis]
MVQRATAEDDIEGLASGCRHCQIALPPDQTGARCARLPRPRCHLPSAAQQPGQQALADLPAAARRPGRAAQMQRWTERDWRQSRGNYRGMNACSIASAAWGMCSPVWRMAGHARWRR